MPDFDINFLKHQWQKQEMPEKYNSCEIREMLNKNSRNDVKYIFWISVAEFLFFILINIFYFFQAENTDSFINILKKLGIENTYNIRRNYTHLYFVMQILTFLVTLFFIIKFYINYKKINTEENLKQFILRIISFRKTVYYFIISNIILLKLFIIALVVFTFYVLKNQNITIDTEKITVLSFGFLISCAICLLIIWLYYRLFYGIFMKRLSKNLEQLKSIDHDYN